MSYAALELITFFIKRHYIQWEFDIDLLKLMHYSIKKAWGRIWMYDSLVFYVYDFY